MTGAPWRVRSIDEMAEHEALFKDNKYTEIVHVNVGEDPIKVDVTKGGLSRTSPPELHFAYLKRLHKLLRLAGEAKPEVCESIQAGILDATARFYALSDAEAWWHEYNLRDRAQRFRGLSAMKLEHLKKKGGQTVFQRFCGLSAMKRMREENGGALAAARSIKVCSNGETPDWLRQVSLHLPPDSPREPQQANIQMSSRPD